MEILEKEKKRRWTPCKSSLSMRLALAATLCAGAGLVVFPREVTDSAANSAAYCLTVLVPSLFPFMALTSFAVTSGAGELIGRYLGFLSRYLFRLPECCTATILLSFVGGYPAGARGVSLLLREKKIDEEQAGRMLLFCVNPGMAFVITFIGGLLGSFATGWMLFFAVTLSGIVLGLVSGLFHPAPKKQRTLPSSPPVGALMDAVGSASRSVLIMCACIMLFSVFISLLHCSGVFQWLCRSLASLGLFTPMESAAVLSFLLEVTGGAGVAAGFRVSPAFYAFGLSFGGLCVHMQVFSFFKKFPGKRWKFFLFRFFHGLLAAGCCWLFQRFLPPSVQEAWASAQGAVHTSAALSGTLCGGLSLLLMCAAFLVIVTKTAEEQELAVAIPQERMYNTTK